MADDSGEGNGGWIKLHRKMITWEWFTEPDTAHLFLYLLLAANHKDKKWKGVLVRRGQIITGFRALAKATGLTLQSTRTSIERLKSTHEITHEPTHSYSIITVCNYDLYNRLILPSNTLINTDINKRTTQHQHTNNTIQEDLRTKEDKEDINITPPAIIKQKFNPEGKMKFLDNVFMDKAQWTRIKTYYDEKGLSFEDLKEAIRELDRWFGDNPKMRAKRTDDAKALMGWPLDNALKRKRELIYTKKAEES